MSAKLSPDSYALLLHLINLLDFRLLGFNEFLLWQLGAAAESCPLGNLILLVQYIHVLQVN